MGEEGGGGGERGGVSSCAVSPVPEEKTPVQTGPEAELTLCDAVAEAALEAAPPLDELHVGTHVGLAAVAADGTLLAVVHQVRRALRRLQSQSASSHPVWI